MKRLNIYGIFILLPVMFILPVLNLGTTDFSLNAEISKVQPDSYGDQLGTVQFPTSCRNEAAPLVERGLALLHHMTYRGARAREQIRNAL